VTKVHAPCAPNFSTRSSLSEPRIYLNGSLIGLAARSSRRSPHILKRRLNRGHAAAPHADLIQHFKKGDANLAPPFPLSHLRQSSVKRQHPWRLKIKRATAGNDLFNPPDQHKAQGPDRTHRPLQPGDSIQRPNISRRGPDGQSEQRSRGSEWPRPAKSKLFHTVYNDTRRPKAWRLCR